MYYYAYLNEDDICLNIYSMPSPISGTQYIAIASNDQTLIGQHYNRTTSEFETVYYYAVLNDSNIVESVTYSTTQQTASDTLIAITFEQYQTVVGMYWDGTQFTEPPISSLAVASTDEVSYKTEEKWLSTKLDEMDAAIADNASDIETIVTNLSTVTTALQTVSNNLSALNTTVEGKANASHTHTASDISGVVKTINGTAPDESGNVVISVSGGGMTASEILEAVKTVDGSGSGLDADTLDGNDASYFASVTALNGKADASHTHEGYATTEAMNTALASKADSTHNHDTAYASATHTHDYAATNHTHDGYAASDHTHSEYATTTALSGKADASHTHSDYITASTYAAGMSNKADADHTHSGYASSSHSHSEYASSSHTHSGYASSTHTHSGYASSSHTHDYLPLSGGTVTGTTNFSGGLVKVGGQQCIYNSGSMVTLATNNLSTMIAGSSIYSKVAISVSSDERLKEGIKEAPVDALVRLVENLDVKTYKYIGSEDENVGIIAQELIEKNPDLEKYFIRQDVEGYYSVKTADLVFPLICAVQKLSKEIEELKK